MDTAAVILATAGGAGEAELSRLALAVPFLPLLGVVLVALCAIFRVRSKLPAWISVACLGGSFLGALWMYTSVGSDGYAIVKAFDWINFTWDRSAGLELVANFSFYVDPLTCLWMLFVSGLACMIALYASEYMSHDAGPGYCRFFAAFNLFVFAMACLVMGDNLILLYLGWEGVGLCSYLLIGYYYQRDSAVAAAKKAFVMNRIGDLGLALGIMLTFVKFGTVEYANLFAAVQPYVEMAKEGRFGDIPFTVQLIPILFAVGAFGKSAQIPLYVWLPDAMEGPTPVSALIHAATMVTAGVYLVARFLPMFIASEYALPLVAWVGTLTALLAATIGMAQFDIKRIMAYSTVSQLGYMFAGLGFLTAAGAAFHVFTHAFFKAVLFLACGAVMHGFAGQLDLRKLSGLGKMTGWGIVTAAMLIGCLNLAGFPLTAGYFSKDMILAEAFTAAGPGYTLLGVLLLLTAGLTAYYTFRVFFRVFMGPKHYEPGDELHEHDHADPEQARKHFHPHAPGWAINLVLAVLAIGSIIAAAAYFIGDKGGWVGGLVAGSTAGVGADAAADYEAKGFFADPHKWMYFASALVGLTGIGVAYVLHLSGRTRADVAPADALAEAMGPIPRWAQNKWYVDELYHYIAVLPLRVISHLSHLIDKLLVDGLVNAVGVAPRSAGRAVRPSQDGVLHGYALRTLVGVGVVLLVVLLVTN